MKVSEVATVRGDEDVGRGAYPERDRTRTGSGHVLGVPDLRQVENDACRREEPHLRVAIQDAGDRPLVGERDEHGALSGGPGAP